MKRVQLITAIPILAMVTIGAAVASPAGADPARAMPCGSVVTQSIKLAADVGPCPGDGLIIAADHVVLDMDGHAVFGMPFNQYGTSNTKSSGILFQGTTGSSVTDGEVYHFATGVRLNSGSNNTVSDMNVHDNIGPRPGAVGDGIALWGSNDNRIDKNLVVHNGRWSGISLLSSVDNMGTDGASYNTVRDNIVRDNNVGAPCRLAAGCGHNHAIPLGQYVGKRDVGIAVEGPGSIHNLIELNSVTGTGTTGIQVFPACINGYDAFTKGCIGTVPNDYNVIRKNTVTHNGFGLPMSGHEGDGIQVTSMGPHQVVMPAHTTIEGNLTNENERNGISLGSGNGPGENGSSVYGCMDISTPCGVNYNLVKHNTASANGTDGIQVGAASDHNTVDHNVADNNGGDGVGISLAFAMDRADPTNPRPILDANGNEEPVPGTGGTDNTLLHNEGRANATYDGEDPTPGCDHNDWDYNRFQTVNQPCVLGSDPQHHATVTSRTGAKPGDSQSNGGEDMYLGRRGGQQ